MRGSEIVTAMDALLDRAQKSRVSAGMPGAPPATDYIRTRTRALIDRQELLAHGTVEKDAIPAVAAALLDLPPDRRNKVVAWAVERLDLFEELRKGRG